MPRHEPSSSLRLTAAGRLAEVALTAVTEAQILDALADGLLHALGVDEVHIQTITDDDVGHAFTRRPGQPDAQYAQPLDVASGVSTVVETGEPLLAVDAPADPRLRQDHVADFQVGTMLVAPLVWDGKVLAAALAICREPHGLTEDDIDTAMVLTRTAAGGCARLVLQRHVEGRVERHAAIARAARSLNESLDLITVLEALCREADLAVDGDFAGVYMADGTGGGVAIAGHDTPEHWIGLRLGPGVGAGGKAIATGRPAIVSDYSDETEVPANPYLDRTRVACAVPMRWGGALRGALSLGWHTVRRVTDTDIEVLVAIAELAAVACANAEAYERAERAARTDSLTGVLNHGAMQVRVGEEISRARREAAPLSCLIIDLDGFKQLNDHAGHLVGDRVLQAVSRALSTEFRPYDQIARYGGDEFVLILPGVEAEGARIVGDRAREAIAQAAAGVEDSRISASVGVAEWREPHTATELLERADRALLAAKRRGRDRVEVAGAAVEEELALDATGGEMLRAFWDMVAAAEHPRLSLVALPSLLRRHLELEEVGLYIVEPGSARSLARHSLAVLPGDPGRRAFGSRTLAVGEQTWDRLGAEPLHRRSLAELWEAVGIGDAPAEPVAGSYACIPLARGGRALGLLVLRSSAREFPAERLRAAHAMAGQAVVVLLGQAGEGSPAAVTALAAAIDARDNYTHTHSEEVVGLACDVARVLGLSGGEVERIRHGALLHDVGKVGIPNEILLKQGPLNDEEWVEMRRHPEIGEGILRRVPELADIAPLVRHEHERWDGLGYPDGLAARDIPVGSRVILACDAYNAMITRRPYREPMPDEDAVAELERCAGTQFDPRVVEALVRVLAARRAAGNLAA